MALLLKFIIQEKLLPSSVAKGLHEHAQVSGESFMQQVLDQTDIEAATLAKQLGRYFNLEQTALEQTEYPLHVIPSTWLVARYAILPLAVCENTLTLAISDPDALSLLANLAFVVGKKVNVLIANHQRLIAVLHQRQQRTKQTTTQLALVENILTNAIYKGASDIHFEPEAHGLRVRFRVDGVLHVDQHRPHHEKSAIVNSIKVLAKLDITNQHQPQDGRITFTTTKKIVRDCRVSTCPTVFGEKVVVRLLERNKKRLNINELGFSEKSKQLFLQAIHKSQGLILVTGPTGSGKTVTLYTALDRLNSLEKNIVTIEDPVEIHLSGITQVPVNIKKGLDFSTGLKTFLRQDPDIIMVGEIRDETTATTALRAAQTGHLVLATVHANSSSETLARLEGLGVDRHLLVDNISLVVAQRLLRRHCQLCCGKGCTQCYQGYKGRIAIYELLQPKQLRPEETLMQAAEKLVKQGVTDQTEVLRVIA